MKQSPQFVSGKNRLDLTIAQFSTLEIVTKIGAQGLLCGALPQQDLGFAIKVHTGVGDIRPLAAYHTLNRWFAGSLTPPIHDRWVDIKNVVGKNVGRLEANWQD